MVRRKVVKQKAEKTLQEVCESINTKLAMGQGDVNVNIGKRRRRLLNEFVYLFYASFLEIIEAFDLQKTEIKIILKILDLMQYGNLVVLNQSSLARELKIDPRNMSKYMKKLRDSTVLIDVDGHCYINPHLLAKGKFLINGHDESEQLLNKAYNVMCTVDQEELISILTPHIKKAMKKNEEIREDAMLDAADQLSK